MKYIVHSLHSLLVYNQIKTIKSYNNSIQSSGIGTEKSLNKGKYIQAKILNRKIFCLDTARFIKPYRNLVYKCTGSR